LSGNKEYHELKHVHSEGVICSLMPNKQFCSYIMARAS